MTKQSHQVLFWVTVFIFLNLLFGWKWNSFIDSFYFTTMLMPIAVGTSYFFNHKLVPEYLQKGKRIQFFVYTLYTIIISVFLSAIIALVAFIFLSDLKWSNMNPIVGDLFQMGIVIYFITILYSFIRLYNAYIESKAQVSQLEYEGQKNLKKTLIVRSNRNMISIALDDIQYIESLSDYVKIQTLLEVIITKEKISQLELKLPGWFVRVHRSFLINQHKLEAYGHDFVQVKSEKLPLGRKYKKDALTKISLSQVNS